MLEVAAWDEAFYCALVAAAGNAEMARLHREVTERIRVIRRLDFAQPLRITATCEEHGQTLLAMQHKRGEQAALHQLHLARQLGSTSVGSPNPGD